MAIAARIHVILQQLGLVRGIRITLLEITRKLFDPFRLSTYAQTGEDRIIESILGIENEGFYVDIGCHHPIAKSNTFQFYLRGWTGLAVDANPDLVMLFRKIRPKDKVLWAAVSDRHTNRSFTIAKDASLSTLSLEFEEEWIGPKGVDKRIEVKTRTLDDILTEAGVPRQFELLSIDVEGSDLAAIKGLDLNTYRPRLVVIEMHGFDLKAPDKNDVYRHLLKNDYRLHSYAIMNGFFTDNRQA